MQDLIIAYHAKNELRGWNEVCRYPANWGGWNDTDRGMINHLLQSGDHVVTLGWNMYEIVKGAK